MVLVSRDRDTGAVHEDDLPDACLFLEESRFQPILVHGGAGGVSDAALIDVSYPCRLAADVDVRLGHIPFVVHARGMLRLDASHDGVSVESGALHHKCKSLMQ